MWRWLLLLAVVPMSAHAVKVPVDVGVGPAAYWFFGPLVNERGALPHFGLKLNVKAVLDQEWLHQNRHLIPPKYVKQMQGVSEVRFSPSLLIPDAILISPRIDSLSTSTGMFGLTWRPLSIGVPLAGAKRPGDWRKSRGRISLEAGLLLTYAFIYSDLFPNTHFLRPGIDLMLELELMASDSFGISFGWASQLYVPQKVGSFGFGPLDESIFHVGQAFLKLHVRFPYDVKL